MSPTSGSRFAFAGVFSVALLVAACGPRSSPTPGPPPSSSYAKAPSMPSASSEASSASSAPSVVAREPTTIWVRLTAERKGGTAARPVFSIALDAPEINLHQVIATITSPYVCRSEVFHGTRHSLSVSCTPRFGAPVATAVFNPHQVEVSLPRKGDADKELVFDLPPDTVARGEERELMAAELEGRVCKKDGRRTDVELRAAIRPDAEGMKSIYLEGSALRERVKVWETGSDYGCSLEIEDVEPERSRLDCRWYGQTNYLWIHNEPDALLLISKEMPWGPPIQLPKTIEELVKSGTANVGRVSLPCGARVHVRAVNLTSPSVANLGRSL